MFYNVECETTLLGLADMENYLSTLWQYSYTRSNFIHTKCEQTDLSKGTYEQTGLTDKTHKTKCTTDIEQYFVDDGIHHGAQ